MRWLGLILISPLVIGLGCGGNVQNSGGNGGSTSSGGSSGGTVVTGGTGGAGGTTVSTTTTTSSSTTTTTTTGMGGAGGGSVCDQACTKLGDCGVPAAQCGQIVDCSQPGGPCYAGCINDPSITCNDVFQAAQSMTGPLWDCVQGCQGGGGGGAGGGGGFAQCQQCGQNSCQNAFIQCAQQAGLNECQAWLTCAQGCQDAACFDMCTTMHPAAQPIADCACTTCAAECGPVCGGGAGGAGGAGMGGAGMGGAGGSMAVCQNCSTLALQGGNMPCAGSDLLFNNLHGCICNTACAAQCGAACAAGTPIQNASLQCQACAGNAVQQQCAAQWTACQNDPN